MLNEGENVFDLKYNFELKLFICQDLDTTTLIPMALLLFPLR